MSLQLNPIDVIPEQTARVAKAAFPGGNLYIRMRDAFGTFFTDAEFADLFPRRGQPALAPWRLALVTIFQFAIRTAEQHPSCLLDLNRVFGPPARREFIARPDAVGS